MSNIDEARKRLERYMECAETVKHSAAAYRDGDGETHLITFDDIRTVLDALDAAERERDAYKRAKAENDERFMNERDEARRERDEALAVIERAKAVTPWSTGGLNPWQQRGLDAAEGYNQAREEIHRILSAVPADVLRERDADRWKEGAMFAWEQSGEGWNGEHPGPGESPEWDELCRDRETKDRAR